jgi:carbon monoxide dehydrogenase subunit G
MTRIESDQVNIQRSQNEIFSFLSDFNNFKSLMPEQVTDWISDANSCSFNIKGMASLGMAYESKTPDSEIRIRREGKAPFDFFLTCQIGKSEVEGNSTLKLFFDADLNPLLKMMAEKPLTNFLNMLVNRYKEIAEAQA